MLKKTITYTDYNEVEHTEDFYFNLSKAELAELETTVPGGFGAMIDKIIKAGDTVKLAELFKDIICRSYGVKSDDGKRFIKNKETLDAFLESEAYSELYFELATNADKAAAFVTGILPKDIRALAEKANTEKNA